MADNKKISELNQIPSLNDADEFVVVDKSTTSGGDASSTGRTSKVTLGQIKEAVSGSGATGQKGQKGQAGSSVKGQKGDQGIQGLKGQQGPQGIQGQSGQSGPAGSPGQKGQKGVAGTSTNGTKGQKGQAGSSVKGQKGQAGTTGTSANAILSWTGSGIEVNSTGQVLRKSSSASSSWATGFGYTRLAYSSGCSISFSVATKSARFMLGLCSDPNKSASSQYTKIDFAIYAYGSNFQIYQHGSRKTDSKPFSLGDIFTITYDNQRVRYFLNGTLIGYAIAPNNKRYHAAISSYNAGIPCTDLLSFIPSGSAGVGAKGQKGQAGSSVKGQKGQAGASVKGQKGSASAIPKYLEERYTFTSNDNNGVFLPMVEGGMFASRQPRENGYIKIELPTSNSNMMMQFYVDVYDYRLKSSFTFRISGYNYGFSTDKAWRNTSVVNLTDGGSDHHVRFCREKKESSSTKHFILIGEASSVWVYPQVNIRDFFGGYHTSEGEALKPWKISFTTSTSNIYTDRSHKNNFPKSTALGPKGGTGLKGQKGQAGASVKGQKGQAGASVKGQKGQQGIRGIPGVSVKGQKGIRGTSVKGQKGQAGVSVKGQKGVIGPKGPIGGGSKGAKGPRGSSATFTGGTVTNPITINSSSSDQKLILRGSSSPYIRFQEGTTDKAYIQWSNGGYLQLVNQETGESLRVGNGDDGLIYRVNGNNRTVYHSGNFDGANFLNLKKSNNTIEGNTTWKDDKSIYLGTGSDFRMWHDGTQNFFRNYKHGAGTHFQSEDSEGVLHAHLSLKGGSRPYVTLFENGAERLRTTSGGVKVTGNLEFTGNLTGNIETTGHIHIKDNKFLYLGNDKDYQIEHDSNNHTYFKNTKHGTGTYFTSENSDGVNRAHFYLEGGSRPYVRLFEAGGERLRTTNKGITVKNHIYVARNDSNFEGGQIDLQTSDGDSIRLDAVGKGNDRKFRVYFKENELAAFTVQHRKTEIRGDLHVTGNVSFNRIKSKGYYQEKLEFSGSAACGIAHDGNLISVQMSPHNSHQAIMRAFDLLTGRYLQLIEPTQNVGKSNVKYTSGNALSNYYYGSLTQAEFHNSNQTEKDRSNSTVFYWSAHSMTHRIEYNMATKKYTSKNLGNTNLGPGTRWTCFATFNAGNSYDSMLLGHPDPHSSHNPDNHIKIWRQNYNGSGFTYEAARYLALSQVSGYKEMVNVDNDSYAYMSFMGINPWSGRVYIWGADDAGSMMHTFQIKSSLRSSGQAWAQVLWNNISASGSPTYGNMGGLEYIHSHKLPYVNEYVNDDASSYNKVITFDPKTKLPAVITISAFGNDHGSGGTKVLGWNDAWT